jgi:hypothetical protein
MKLFGWIVCGGLALSGTLMILGLAPGREGLLSAHFFGYWFGLAAALVYIVHSSLVVFRYNPSYWESLTPFNAGLTAMGVALIMWDLSRPTPLAAIALGVGLAAVCAALSLDRYRFLVVLPFIPFGALFFEATNLDAWAVITAIGVFLVAMPIFVSFRRRLQRTGPGQSNSLLQPTGQKRPAAE